MSKLTVQEAQAVINYVRRAPLQGMDEAEAVSSLLQTLKTHFEDHFNPKSEKKAEETVIIPTVNPA